MTNYEKHKEFIDEMQADLAPIAVVNNEPTLCSMVDCDDCDLCGKPDVVYCTYKLFEWLKAECEENE